MNARKGPASLGDPQSVRDLLAIVTGEEAPAGRGGVPAVAGDAPGTPAACPLRAGSGGVLLTVERTPREIRALRDEGIIGTC